MKLCDNEEIIIEAARSAIMLFGEATNRHAPNYEKCSALFNNIVKLIAECFRNLPRKKQKPYTPVLPHREDPSMEYLKEMEGVFNDPLHE